MELPGLGRHCAERACRRLDFLPLKCDACGEVFCKDHIRYDDHKCGSAYKKNVQVPVCPLCNAPVPVQKGEIPDVVVGAHMDKDCKYNPAQHIFCYVYCLHQQSYLKAQLFELCEHPAA
uniref:Zinc finger AN1-type containing 2A n=1 Tax=Anser brachyrhynchus TaxID=132585 RepID=A0A8B9BNV5_9AVES